MKCDIVDRIHLTVVGHRALGIDSVTFERKILLRVCFANVLDADPAFICTYAATLTIAENADAKIRGGEGLRYKE